MFLVKSCYSQDHILKRKTIKIGSLDEYRKIEEQQIADPDEGTVNLLFNLEQYTMHRVFFNFINSYQGAKGVMDVEEISFVAAPNLGPDYFQVKKYKANKSLVYNNKFIFCISCLENPDDALGIFPKYDSKWVINFQNTKEFAQLMSNEVLSHITRRIDNGERIFTQEVSSDKLRVNFQVAHVTYTDRNTIITNADLAYNSKQVYSMMTMAHFVKTNNFQKERELRFVFDFYYGDTILEPIEKSIIINAENILHLIHL